MWSAQCAHITFITFWTKPAACRLCSRSWVRRRRTRNLKYTFLPSFYSSPSKDLPSPRTHLCNNPPPFQRCFAVWGILCRALCTPAWQFGGRAFLRLHLPIGEPTMMFSGPSWSVLPLCITNYCSPKQSFGLWRASFAFLIGAAFEGYPLHILKPDPLDHNTGRTCCP